MPHSRGKPHNYAPTRTVDRPDGEVITGKTPKLYRRDCERGRRGVPRPRYCSGTSGEGRLALPISNEQFFWSDFRSKCVVHVLEPDKLSLQVTYSLLKAAHLRDDAGIWPADVAE